MTTTLYHDIRNRLKAAGVDDPGLESRVLLRDVLGASDGAILAGDEIPATPAQGAALEAMLVRREAGEPLSRVLGFREFWGLNFKLSPDTLDPRPDTETLIETALNRFEGHPPKRILDIGTGTGCILISLLHEWPGATGVATDLSAGALETARENPKVGDELVILKDELTAVLGQMTMFIYRPESALSPFFNVVARIQNEGVGLPEDITYLVERNAKKGYAPVQAKVLSAMEFNKGDQMQVSMVNLYTTTRGGEKLYRFQDKEYQNRLWDTIKQLGR